MTKSLLDTDTYKLSMLQAVYHNYPGIWSKYSFKWRNWDKMHLSITLENFVGILNDKIEKFCSLSFGAEELAYLSTIRFFKRDFIEFLKLYRPDKDYIRTYIKNDEVIINIEGPWIIVEPYEVPILSIVSETYTENCGHYKFNLVQNGRKRLNEKIGFLKRSLHQDQPFRFSDFGTRRRAYFDFHEEIIETLLKKANPFFVGTSNLYFAMKYGIKPIGTMAHEWIQAHQALFKLKDSQRAALDVWEREYRGDLGIALSDTLGFDSFLVDFDKFLAKLFDGCRHDSGDPYEWCVKLINHYNNFEIDPKTKSAIFSDGLTFEIAVDIFRRFNNLINTGFGIGTYLTHDVGTTPPQIVIKMVECDGEPVAKVSDDPGKGMCENGEYLTYLNQVIQRKLDGAS